jgi:RNA polymerase sigma factor (sigma-70 family)
MECPEEEPGDGDQIDLEQERRISSLAMRYRLGERSVLSELYAGLEPFIHSSIRRRVVGPRLLPPSVDQGDLYQQAYVALAEAVLEWDPGRRRNFVPYFLRSFPWRIDHYLRSQTPSRRTARFQMLSTPHDELMESLAGRPGLDGRDWDGALECEDLLRRVPRSDRQVVRLHLFNGLPFAEVGKIMGISRSAAHEAFARAMALMRKLLD